MKLKNIIIYLIIILILTSSVLFIKIVPCRSWYGSNTGIMEDLGPHNTFCNVFYGFGPHNEYYYITTSPANAILITFIIFSIIVFIIAFILARKK